MPFVSTVLQTWSPLAEGETAARALAAAEAIARDLSSDPAVAPGMHLSGGQPGLALFFDSLEKSLGHAEAGERAGYHLDRAVTALMEQAAPSASLYSGFAGVAWVTEILAAGEASAEEEVSAEEEDPNSEIDQALLSLLQQSPWQGEFDLIGGLVGWGVYALERLPRPSAAAVLELIVTRLAERAEWGENGVSWSHPLNPLPWPDPGMAHGTAGAIALLARILQEGAASPEAASLLAAAVDGVLASSSPREGGEESDLAWCAGNAGLSVAVLAGARACDRDDWERAACRLATASAERYADHAPGLDPALCHGTAGLCHLFHRLYQATGDPVLLAAARRWLERTLEQWQPGGEGIGGFRCRGRQADGSVGWTSNPGFLTGSAGIGLALLAAITPVEPAWDRVLLLSGRSRGAK